VYKQVLINTSQIGTIGQKAELGGRSALMGRRCALGAVWPMKEEEEEKEDKKEKNNKGKKEEAEE
jgi:hypothetical protein